MSLSAELKELETLLRNGTLTAQEFEIAKRRVLAGGAGPDASAHLEEIKAQNELAQLDREWEMERERYMVTGKYGTRHIPGKVSSVLGGVFIVGFGILWTVFASGMTGMGSGGMFDIFPLFGLLFILFGAGMSIYSYTKAGQYEQAHARYQRRRRNLRSGASDNNADGFGPLA